MSDATHSVWRHHVTWRQVRWRWRQAVMLARTAPVDVTHSTAQYQLLKPVLMPRLLPRLGRPASLSLITWPITGFIPQRALHKLGYSVTLYFLSYLLVCVRLMSVFYTHHRTIRCLQHNDACECNGRFKHYLQRFFLRWSRLTKVCCLNNGSSLDGVNGVQISHYTSS